MNIIPILFSLLLLDFYSGETPRMTCRNLKPFKTADYQCDNFSNVCIKKGDQDCESFMEICAQCPATNYSVLMFYDITKIKGELENTKLNMNNIATEMKTTKEKLIKITNQLKFSEQGKNIIYILLWIIIIINILMFFLLLLEIRFKIITKLIDHRKRKGSNQYKILESRKSMFLKNYFMDTKEVNEKFELQHYKFEHKIESKLIEILNILNTSTNLSKLKEKSKFRMNGNTIKIKIEKKDNCVVIKRRICHKLYLVKSEDYKILKLKYNGKTLEDNQYFSTFNIPTDKEILCEKDLSINSSNILVVKPAGNIQLPDLIQIQKHQTISDLKKLTPGISDAENLRIFAEIKDGNDKKQFKILEEESTVAQCNIIDEEFLYFISREVKKLAISSIFDEGNSAVIDYDNTDTILAMKMSLCTPLNCCLEDFVLIQKGTLSEEAFAFEYDFTGNDPVKYCRISKLVAIEIGDCVNDGNHSDLFSAKMRVTNKKLLIKKYFHTTEKKFADNIYIIREIITFQLTKDHPRFVNLYGVYNDPKCFYVAMENMELGTLKSFINKNKPTENDIKKWSSQMLEGLKYLHDQQVIHRDLNPSSILLNESKDLKLSSFNLSKYKILNEPSSVFVKDVEDLHKLPIKYFAPEILRNERFTTKADVWSFGAILIKIITQRAPFPGKPKLEIKTGFENNEIGDYDCSALQCGEGLRRIIMSCLKIDQGTRSTVESLLNEDFINQ